MCEPMAEPPGAALPRSRDETLARVRILIKQVDPEVVEEWKGKGVARRNDGYWGATEQLRVAT
jgi:hypothetical protein